MDLTQIKFLPDNIKDLILSYHACPQPSLLLIDIRNFMETKKHLERIYYHYFRHYMRDMNKPLEDKYWIINDIGRFLNQNVPTMYYYLDSYYEVLERNIYLFKKKNIMIFKTKKKILNDFIESIDKKDVRTQINMYWGLMNTEERNQILQLAIFNKEGRIF